MDGVTRVRSSTVLRVSAEPSPEKTNVSFFDSFFLNFPAMKTVFLYPSPSVPFASVVSSLKSSLSQVLPLFYSFAGTLRREPSGVVVDCTDLGVEFIEAETDLDFAALVGKDVHHIHEFSQFAAHIEIGKLPAPVMSVQVTEFSGGGMALGVTVHHGAVDGAGLWSFVEVWKQTCRSGVMPPVPKPPVHDRAVIVNALSADKARMPCLHQEISADGGGPRLERRTLVVTGEMIQHLKKHLAPYNSGILPSTFSALTTHAWVSLAQTKDLKNGPPVGAIFIVDCRSRLRPPVDAGYTGNCVIPAFVKLSGADLEGPDAYGLAYQQFKNAVAAANEDPMKYYESVTAELNQHPIDRLIMLTGSPRFVVYDTDFGWGPPALVDLSSVDHGCEVSVAAGKTAGTVEAAITLPSELMKDVTDIFQVKI